MIIIKNVKDLTGKLYTHTVASALETSFDAQGLTLLPALIDPHVHFRVPGAEHKEDWKTASKAALKGGVTTVFDMPNTHPACTTLERLLEKKARIADQLKEGGIPLRHYFYLGADRARLDEIPRSRADSIGLKIFMGSSTGELLVDDDPSLENAFETAAKNDVIVSVHAEDEAILRAMKEKHPGPLEPYMHSVLRCREAAVSSVYKAIALSDKYGTRLNILHVSAKEEVDLIRAAKKRGSKVVAETTPHHLFLSEQDYKEWGCRVQMNPPLRTEADQEALWEGIHDGTIDMIGTDHAPHTLVEKQQPYGKAPSGIPGIETLLPLLLNAHSQGRLSLKQIAQLTRWNIEKIFALPKHDDVVLVDLDRTEQVRDEKLKTKCGWSPFTGRFLKGWPVYTIIQGQVFKLDEI